MNPRATVSTSELRDRTTTSATNRIYEPSRATLTELAQPVDAGDFDTINEAANGTPRGKKRRAVKTQIVHEDEGCQLKEADAPWYGSQALVLRPRAVQEMQPLLAGHVELLPLDCDEAPLVLVNPLRVVDALDEKSTSILRFKSSCRIMKIAKHVFFADRIAGLPLFKIKSLDVSPTFVSDAFVARWKAAGLRGVDFTEVWSG